MCGIAGIFAYRDDAAPVDREELLRIRDHMARRGPDGAGLWYSDDGRTGLAHRRLAIIDLSDAGAQPMVSADGRYRVTFNGEIYNYRERRRELEGRGFAFRSNSDTEVLLHLYADRGAAMVDALRGIFAFGLWDSRERTLFLARDHFGVKPLYYADDGRTLRFASQVKALRAGGAIADAPAPAGAAGFLILGAVPEPWTMFRDIRSVPAGATLTVRERSAATIATYFGVREALCAAQDAPKPNREDAQRVLAEAARDAVRANLVADVPVGVFLSAGIDSGTITGLARETGAGDLRTLTLGFNEYRGTPSDEVPLAEDVARLHGTRHETHRIGRDDFLQELPAILEVMDQPSIDGVNTYLVSRAAARSGMRVALSGLGGDEIFGGYPSFRQVPASARLLGWSRHARWLGKGARAALAPWIGRFTSPKYAGLFEYGGSTGGAYLLRRSLFMPWELGAMLDPATVDAGLEELDIARRLDAAASGIRSAHARVAALEMTWYMRNQLLRDADWAGMAHSLEIRVPLIDVDLFRALAPALTGATSPTKTELARTPRVPLPESVVARAKSGFTTPVREWVDGMPGARGRGLRGWAKVVLGAASARAGAHASEAPAVLVYRIGQLGDALVAIPAVRAIRARHPDERMILLTDRHPARKGWVSTWDVLGELGIFDDVVFYEPAGSTKGSLATGRALARRLQEIGPRTVYNLAPARSPWQRLRDRAFFVSVVGATTYRAPPAISRHVARDASGSMVRAQPEWERLLAAVGSPPSSVSARFAVSSETSAGAASLREAAGGAPGRPAIAIGPGSKMQAKRWPAERFASVIESLQARFPDHEFLIFGDASDAPIGDSLASRFAPRCVNLAGRLSIVQSAALLARCSVYVGNDTGTMHLAAAAGCPCVAIFSARDRPGHWEPFGAGHRVFREDPPCAGCMLETCVEMKSVCLTRIAAEDVADAATAILAAASQRQAAHA